MLGAALGIVDTHVHVVSPDRRRYPVAPRDFAGGWWRSEHADAEHLLAELDAAEVKSAVVVQAVGVYGYDGRYAREAVAAHPDRLRLVGAVDMSGPDPPGAVAVLCADGVVGVRLFGVGGVAPTWLIDERGKQLWRTAERWAVPLVPTLLPDALTNLYRLVEARPEVAVALDHCGFPDLSGGAPFPRATSLFRLADLPSVQLKLTTHVLQQAARVGDPADLIDALVAAFGAERLCWGSDHPQTADITYPEKLALAGHAARRLTDAQRDALFGNTAAQLGWDAAETG